MGSRLEFDEQIETCEPDKDTDPSARKDDRQFFEYLENSSLINDPFDPLANPHSLSHFEGSHPGPNESMMYGHKQMRPAGASASNSSTLREQNISHMAAASHNDNYMYPQGMPHSQNVNAHASVDQASSWSGNAPPDFGHHHSGDTPIIATALADPVINVVAPEEATTGGKHFGDDAYPMYSANGVPIHGSQVPEFQQVKVEKADFSTISSLASPISQPGSSFTTPYGTPHGSPLMLPNSPHGQFGQVTTPVGSPLSAHGPQSPYDAPYYSYKEEGMSPLIDDDDTSSYFEHFDPLAYMHQQPMPQHQQQPSQSQSQSQSQQQSQQQQQQQQRGSQPQTQTQAHLARADSLNVPQQHRKSRALSDSWNPQERDAFLESLDAQAHFAQSMPSGGPLGQGMMISDAAAQAQFPRYTPVNVRPHSPQLMFPGGGNTNGSGNPNSNDNGGEMATGSAAHPNARHIYSNSIEGHNTGASLLPSANLHPNGSPGYGDFGLPMQTRGRSLSSPYEPSNDLKASQMFSCELCGKRFTRAYNLRSHMRTHTDERPFACQHCGKAFARQHDRKRHEALHSGEKRFVCHGLTHGFQWGCKKRFARADALGRHFRTEAGKNCLRPLIEKICSNGNYREGAPEGILFAGIIDSQPQLILNTPERESSSSLSSEEREEQTRRTVILTAVTEQFQELVEGNSRH